MTRMRPHRATIAQDRLHRAHQQDMSLGLHSVAEFNQSIRYADSKAGALAASQGLIITVLAGKRDSLTGSSFSTLVFLGCLCAVVISVVLLAASQVPRLTRYLFDRPHRGLLGRSVRYDLPPLSYA